MAEKSTTEKKPKARGKKQKAEVVGQADPKTPLDSAAFLAAAKPLLARLEDDLVARVNASPAVTHAMTVRYAAEKAAQRTADSFAGWTGSLATQVAAAWLLSCVFVRTLEDRGLLRQNRLAGPGAEDSQKQFFQLSPSLTERDYLMTVFRELAHSPAAASLFDAEHSLVWKLSPSAEVAKELLALFRSPSASGPAFRFGQVSTRFLGDLYQDLSEEVRKKYALLQTPDFIEEYILDHTLEPAIKRFGLDDTTLIDPACGSGHFLLGAFARLFEHRVKVTPGLDARLAAVQALDCVFGADINPYAIAIARFRLFLEFLSVAGYGQMSDAPQLPLHLVCADSLLLNPQHPQQELWHQASENADKWLGNVFAFENEDIAKDVLGRTFAAVVGNPPYIVPKDATLRDRYRRIYTTAAMQYSLAAPFCERFFQLARPRGFTGQITANSFMKREFGRTLVEDFLPTVNLSSIVNTSGAFIPGHGTPTVLLFGTNDMPQGDDVPTVLSKRGEPSAPQDPRNGFVWKSISDHGHELGFDNDYISVSNLKRANLSSHPWSLGGGGANELKELLEHRMSKRLRDVAISIGRVAHTGNDEAFVASRLSLQRHGLNEDQIAPFVEGEMIRDWGLGSTAGVVFPYDDLLAVCTEDTADARIKYLWPYRSLLWERREPNGTHREIGLTWYEFSRFHPERFRGMCIGFAEVATHNHFILDRGNKVFKQTAPAIKLHEDSTETDYLALIAFLNSSTACFWLKQICFDKGNRGEGGGFTSEEWEKFYQFNPSSLQDLPLPTMDTDAAAHHARRLLETAKTAKDAADLTQIFHNARSLDELDTMLAAAALRYTDIVDQLRIEQEKLDWWVYHQFALTDKDLSNDSGKFRASDVLFARGVENGQPGKRYFSLCRLPESSLISVAPAPATHLAAIKASPYLALLETPAYKRTFREGFRPIDVMSSAKEWIAQQIESVICSITEVISHREIDTALSSRSLGAVVREWLRRSSADSDGLMREIANSDAVPFAAALRYSETGIARHQAWSLAWLQQGGEDREGLPTGTTIDSSTLTKYTAKDFRNAEWFRLRGAIDLPKERFISYPFCESDHDGEPVYGWAGWDHLQRAQALASLYLKRKDGEGWAKDRLTPILAGLLELIPWVKQWHNEPSDEFGGLRMGEYFEQFLDGECRQHNLTHDDLRAWRPPAKTRGRKPKIAAAKTADAFEQGLDSAKPEPKKKTRKATPKTTVKDAE